MLDETTCPVCGKELVPDVVVTTGESPFTLPYNIAIWAVAHYLAHLVQQKANEDIDLTQLPAFRRGAPTSPLPVDTRFIDSQPLRDPSETEDDDEDDDDDGPDHLTWTADDVHSTDVHPVFGDTALMANVEEFDRLLRNGLIQQPEHPGVSGAGRSLLKILQKKG